MAIIKAFLSHCPQIDPSAWVAETATIIGEVAIGANSSVWYGALLRGDVGYIRLGARSNVQDGCIIHMTTDLSNTEIGNDVTVGHGAILHGATIADGALIGMGAIIMDNAVVGEQAIVAAGSVVPARMHVPPRTLVRGQPARVVRELREDEWLSGQLGAARYVELARMHASATA